MDITFTKVDTVALIQHKSDGVTGFYNTLVIYTDKGQISYRLDLFGDKPLTIQLGDNEQ